MKTLKSTALLIIAIVSFSSAALANEGSTSKIVKKAIESVKNAEADDWETLAESAEICLMKEENLEQAALWVDKSIAIKETAYNLELKGDFLAKTGKKQEALKYYSAAASKIKEENPNADNSKIQTKIWKLR